MTSEPTRPPVTEYAAAGDLSRDSERATPVRFTTTRQQRAVALVVAIFLLAGVCGVLFGPARGARDDIGELRDDLDASRRGIGETVEIGQTTLDRLARQLKVTERSLTIQRRGLRTARESQEVARVGVNSTRRIEAQTTQTLTTLRRVVAALGPLRRLRGDVKSVVANVEAGVSLARTTLGLARRTLADGQRALTVAIDTLATLRGSKQVQEDLLAVARATLEEVREINAKIPLPPVFPTPNAVEPAGP